MHKRNFDRSKFKVTRDISPTISGWLLVSVCARFMSKVVEEKDVANPRIATLLRPRFDHLPPTLFIVAECDPLRDDSYGT